MLTSDVNTILDAYDAKKKIYLLSFIDIIITITTNAEHVGKSRNQAI